MVRLFLSFRLSLGRALQRRSTKSLGLGHNSLRCLLDILLQEFGQVLLGKQGLQNANLLVDLGHIKPALELGSLNVAQTQTAEHKVNIVVLNASQLGVFGISR